MVPVFGVCLLEMVINVGNHTAVREVKFDYWSWWLLLGVIFLIVFACWGVSLQRWGVLLGFVVRGLTI